VILAALITAAMAAQPATYMNAHGYWLQVEATAYSPLDSMTRDDENNPRRLTATGISALRRPYGIAADPTALPYGTRIIIPTGYGYLDRSESEARVFTVDDTGSIVKWLTRHDGVIAIDLRYISVSSAIRFGRKTIWVFVIAEPL